MRLNKTHTRDKELTRNKLPYRRSLAERQISEKGEWKNVRL